MAAERNFYRTINAADRPQAAAPQTVRGESLSDQTSFSRVNQAPSHGRWIVNTEIPLATNKDASTIGPSRGAKDTVKGIMEAVQLHKSVHGVSTQTATEMVMGTNKDAAEHWATVSGFQSSIPMRPRNEGEISQSELLDKARKNAPSDHKGYAAKLLIAAETQKAYTETESNPSKEEDQISPQTERLAQKREAEFTDRKRQALQELVKSGKISKEEMAEDMTEQPDVAPHELYEFHQAVSDLIEVAEATARIKKAQGDKPKHERLTLMNGDQRLLSAQLGRNPKYEVVPFESDRTAEVVTWSTTSDSPDVVEEFGKVVRHVDRNGGLLVAQVPHSLDAALKEKYGHTEDGVVLELNRIGRSSTVIYRHPHRDKI